MSARGLIVFLKENKWNLLLQLILWVGAYFLWFNFSVFRFRSNLPIECLVFWMLFAMANIHNWGLYPYLYKKQYTLAYFITTVFLLFGVVLVEYYLAINQILKYLNPEDRIPEYIMLTKIEVFGGIFIRDFALMLLFTLYYLYKDSIRFQRIQSEEIEYLKKYEQVQNEMRYYFCHEHFTQNALSILAYRFPDNPQKTKELLTRLFQIYQYSFSKASESIVPIKEEIRFANALIGYYQTIFPEVKVSLNIQDEIPPFSVPPLITESIIGNAFKHGITDATGEIEIIFDFTNPFIFSFSCRNKYDASTEAVKNPNANGLKFVQKRLAFLYRSEGCISWNREAGGYFTTCINFPI